MHPPTSTPLILIGILLAIMTGCRSERVDNPPPTEATTQDSVEQLSPDEATTAPVPARTESPESAAPDADATVADSMPSNDQAERALPMPATPQPLPTSDENAATPAEPEGAPDVDAEMGSGTDDSEVDEEIMAHIRAQRAALRRLADTYDAPPGAKQLGKEPDLWVDMSAKRVYVDGYVSMQRGPLEMLACPVGTKEHESVVAVFAKSSEVHAALLAIGAKSGQPVQWDPEYAPPTGQTIQVWIAWRPSMPVVVPEDTTEEQDAEEPNPHSPEYRFIPSDGYNVVDARKWVRNTKTQSELSEPWVFAGSEFWTDPEDGVEYYSADAGDMICVSNFRSAMLDVPFRSSADTGNLLFEPFTERVPERGTPVRLILVPQSESSEETTMSPPDEDVLPIAAAAKPEGE